MAAAVWVLLIIGLCIWVAGRGSGSVSKAPRAATPRVGPPPVIVPDRQPDVIGGLIAGHFIAHGHDGFPGDPLPDGHLGSPANVAFWSTAFDEDEEDE